MFLEEGLDLVLRGGDSALDKIRLAAAPALESLVESFGQGAKVPTGLAYRILVARAVLAGEDVDVI
jgi:hypothetical protein